MNISLATLEKQPDTRITESSPELPIRSMLAHTFRGKLPEGPLFSQPKLDGVRCLGTLGLWSRTGNRVTSCAHIEAALRPTFGQHPDLILDGELYSHALRDDLAAIISLLNTRRPDQAARARCKRLIGFHVVDLPSHAGPFSARQGALVAMIAAQLHAPSPLARDDAGARSAHLDELFVSDRAAGYEGQMIRQDAPYEPTRSTRLLKREPFEDAGFEVVRLIEVGGTHAGYVKRAVLRLPDGRTFLAGIKGSRDHARALLGREFKYATVRYEALGKSGIPRSPNIVAFDTEQGGDHAARIAAHRAMPPARSIEP